MYSDTALRGHIQEIRLAAESPLVQYDILDSTTLFRIIDPDAAQITAKQLAKCLRALGMRPLGLHSVEGFRCNVWTCLPYQHVDDIVARLRERIQGNLTELKTEILVESGLPVPPAARQTFLTPLERAVLGYKIQRYPARRIAAVLNVPRHEVYAASQQIKNKLRVEKLSDPVELKHAAKTKNALMDDPAFWPSDGKI